MICKDREISNDFSLMLFNYTSHMSANLFLVPALTQKLMYLSNDILPG